MFFQKRKGGRCLVLDNHAIFGGEAKRNEFLVDGQTVVAHQGSAMFPVPKKGGYVAGVYEMIGMDRPALEYQRWRGPSPEMPLSQTPYDTLGARRTNFGLWFGPRFGQQPGVWVIDPWHRNLEGAPLSDADKAELMRWRTVHDGGPRPKTEGDEISRHLDTMTLEDYVMASHHITRDTVRNFLSPVEGGGYGLGPDVLSAYCAYAPETEYPDEGDDALGDQMFPDGNAGFARLMVKTLIPDAIAGPRTVEAVWRNRVRFAALDRRDQPTRIRLEATVLRVEHAGDPATRAARERHLREGRQAPSRARAQRRHGRRQLDDEAHRERPPAEPSRRVRAVLSLALPHGERRRAQLALPVRHGHLRLPLVRGTRQLLRGAQAGHRRRQRDIRPRFADRAHDQGAVREAGTSHRRAGIARTRRAVRDVVHAVRARLPPAARRHVRRRAASTRAATSRGSSSIGGATPT